jgi:signal transduction histidine kinase
MNPPTINGIKPVSFTPTVFRSVAKVILKPSFAAALTHEVRNPLTNIDLAVGMLQRLEPGTAQQPYLDIILRASKRINMLVAELAGKQQGELEKEEVHSVHQLLDEVLTMTADRILLKHIAVSKEFDLQDYSITEHNPEMKIALTNLIINAIDAVKEHKGMLKLVTAWVNGNYILAIEDNGCGISPGDIKDIFRPFFTRKTGGLGIGLAVTYDILKANNVEIDVESEEGKGTKFILSFKKASPVFLISKPA